MDTTLTQRSHLNLHLLVTEENHQERNHSRVNDHLDLFITSVCQVGQSPNRVYQDLNTHTKPVRTCSGVSL